MRRTIIAVIMAAVVMIAAVVPVGAVQYTQTVLESYLSYYPSPSGWYDVQTILYDTFPTNGMYQLADGAGFGPCFLVDEWAENAVYLITCDITYTFSNTSSANENLSSEKLTGRNLALFNESKPETTTQSGLTGSNSQGVDYSNLANFSFSPLSSTSTSGTYTCTQVISFSTESGQIDNIDNKLWATFWTCFDQEGKFSYDSMTLSVVYDVEPSVYDLILEKLDEILANMNESNTTTNNFYQTIESAVTEIINNQNTQITNQSTIINQQQQTNTKLDTVNNYLQTIYTYGSEYAVPEGAADLAASQEKLSGAEKAVSDKSTSLTNSVASTWSGNKTTAMNFISTITPATAAITTILADITAVMPAELQAALVAIPMIIFIGWLIGRLD